MAVHSGESRDQRVPNVEADSPVILEEALRSAVSNRVGATRFALWFGGNVRLGLNRDSDSLIVRVPDSFFRDWIERHYTPSLVDAVEAVVGRRLRVSVQIHGESELCPGDSAEPGLRPLEPNIEPRLAEDYTTPLPGNPRLPLSLTTSQNHPGSPTHLGPGRAEIDRSGRGGTASPTSCLILPVPSSRPIRRLEDYVDRASQPRGNCRRYRDSAYSWSYL